MQLANLKPPLEILHVLNFPAKSNKPPNNLICKSLKHSHEPALFMNSGQFFLTSITLLIDNASTSFITF